MNFATLVRTPRGCLAFECKVHYAKTAEELKLGEALYHARNRGTSLEKDLLPTYELEVIFASNRVRAEDLGLHRGKYVLYLEQIPGIEYARVIWEAWCAGTGCAYMGDPDLDVLVSEAGGWGELKRYASRYNVTTVTTDIEAP